MKKSLLAAASLVIAGLVSLPSSAAPAEPPPSLAGEAFQTGYQQQLENLPCNRDGESSATLHFSGVASGPYPGRFEEDVSFTIGPQTDPASRRGQVVKFDASFVLTSGDYTITGTKQVIVTGALNGGCFQGATPTEENRFYVDNYEVVPSLSYSAVIRGPQGSFTDSGRANAFVLYQHYFTDRNNDGIINVTDGADELQASGFFENFLTSTGVQSAGPGPATTLTLDPPAATNPVGTSHTVTAFVTDASGAAAKSTGILFQVRGSVTTDGRCTTTNGQCSFTYQGPQLPGADSITACADNNANGSCDVGEPVAEATKAWLLPTSTPGQVTGGGQIPSATDSNKKVAFGFNAQSKNGGLKGECTVVDQAPVRNIEIKCLDVTSLVQTGTHATFFGNATVNGAATTYRIDVDDLGEPGKDRDTFRIQTGSGYSGGGTISQGNIQVHR